MTQSTFSIPPEPYVVPSGFFQALWSLVSMAQAKLGHGTKAQGPRPGVGAAAELHWLARGAPAE